MSPKDVRVSVLLPVFNAADTLPEALDSLLAQTLAGFEIVAVDDGSTDSSPAILRETARQDPRLRLFLRPHQGLVPALNLGLDRCLARFVARMDADDRCHPTRLEKQLALLQERPEISVVGCLVRGFPAGEVREGYRIYQQWQNSLVTPDEIAREIFIESPLAHPSVMLRRDELRALGGYVDRGWPEDYELWLRYHHAGKQFAKVPEFLLDWRERPGRLTRTDPHYSVENFLRAKAHYLAIGPLADRDAVIVWGAGQMGRRLSKHLVRSRVRLVAHLEIDPEKIGGTLRGVPIVPVEALPTLWDSYQCPALLSAVASRGARKLIRGRLAELGLVEGKDFWCVA